MTTLLKVTRVERPPFRSLLSVFPSRGVQRTEAPRPVSGPPTGGLAVHRVVAGPELLGGTTGACTEVALGRRGPRRRNPRLAAEASASAPRDTTRPLGRGTESPRGDTGRGWSVRTSLPLPQGGAGGTDKGLFWASSPGLRPSSLLCPNAFLTFPGRSLHVFSRSGKSAALQEASVAYVIGVPSGPAPRRSPTCDLGPPTHVPGSESPLTRGSRPLAAGISGCDSELHFRGPRSSHIFQGQFKRVAVNRGDRVTEVASLFCLFQENLGSRVWCC